ncbi:MAG: trypsin-like peptidase domain-containing protein [Clostridia bacterium]|nr:trypsin-like peptidase domain-containing protein [Clostridia bacterium]
MEDFNNLNDNLENEQAPKTETQDGVTEFSEQADAPVAEPAESVGNDADMVEEVFETVETEQPEPETKAPYIPPYSPINYTKVEPMETTKPMSRGLKFFALLLALVIALTAACAGGYYLGKVSVSQSFSKGEAVVGLEAKPTNTDEMTAAQVYEKVNASVVGIVIYNASGEMANASGVVYSNDGYIVTNDHIYSEIASPKFKIYTYDNKEYDAQYIAGDKVSDLAVLKVNDGSFKAAVFGNSNQIIFGENVVAIGRPGGATNASSVTKGIVSATSRRVQTTSSYSARLIETDCPINPGSSGGVLVNMYGQVVGITSSKLASSDIDAVGYAIPTTTVKRIVEELIKSGKVLSRAKLGITYRAIDSVSAEIEGYKYEGLYVDSVSEDSDLFGKVTKGDIITHINGIEVTSDEIVLDIIEKSKAGDNVKVTFVNSSGKSKSIQATLKANVGESSYFTKEQQNNNALPQLPDESEGNGGAFNFPFGE